MHREAIVIVGVDGQEYHTKLDEEMAVLRNAEESLEHYVGIYYDDFNTDSSQFTNLKNYFTLDKGEDTVCRARAFAGFTRENYQPYYIINGRIIDYAVMRKYGVSWSWVLQTEIKEAKKDDSDHWHIWFVIADVHI